MFFVLSKIVGALIKPIFWILLLLLTGLWKSKWRKKCLIWAAILTFLFGNKYIINTVVESYEYPQQALTKSEQFDVAVVLGGYSRNRLENGRLELNEAGDRLIAALDLLRTKQVKRIILSGGDGSLYNTGINESAEVLIYLKSVGYNTAQIQVEANSKNTYENAVNAASLIQENEKVILITSAFHMPRATACFSKQSIEHTPYPVDYLMDGSSSFSPSNLLIPDGMAFEKWEVLLKEWVGYFAYKISGKL